MPDWESCCESVNESVRRRRILICVIFWGLIFLAFAIRVIKYYSYNPSEVQSSSNKSFDYLILALSWPISYCRWHTDNGTNAADTCNLSKNENNWLIHGLWPNKVGYYSEIKCPLTSFDENEMETIRDQLDEYWPSTKKNLTNTGFWKHEWSKHGACALQFEQLNTQLKYFQRSLELYKRYNVTKVLKDCGIYPDDSKLYKKAEFIRCFEEHFEASPRLSCKKMRKNSTLVEIRFCFDENLIVRNCEYFRVQKNCESDFIYPANVDPIV